MRNFFLVILACIGFALAAPDSLVVEAAGVRSATGIWWPASAKKPSKAKVSAKAVKANVVVWFHGGMTSSNCEKGYVAGRDLSELFNGLIVVSVSACRENHWVTENMVQVVDAALDSVATRRKADVNDVLLVGVSDGGLGTIVYSLYGKRNVKNRLLVSSFGEFLGASSEVAAAPRLHTGRWRFLQGGADRLYPITKTRPWIESFCANVGTDCEIRYDSAGEHDWQYWRSNRLQWIADAILVTTP